jgi:hypothetical protein
MSGPGLFAHHQEITTFHPPPRDQSGAATPLYQRTAVETVNRLGHRIPEEVVGTIAGPSVLTTGDAEVRKFPKLV